MKKMAILVVGYDGYSDVWDIFFELLNKYWEKKDYNVYLANNELKKEYENVNVINSGRDSEWSKRVQTALEKIEEEYICLLLEDFFIGDYIEDRKIKEVLSMIENEKILYYKLDNFSVVKTEKFKNIKHLQIINKKLEYGISLQAAIWEKNFLKKLVGQENYNAWRFEADRLEEKIVTEEEFGRCVFDNRNILNIKHAVVQGLYLKETVEYFRLKGYNINLEKRKILSGKKQLRYRIKKLASNIVPLPFRKQAKRIGKILGFEFISDKNSK